MKIAVLGWGSLIWQKGCLRVKNGSYNEPSKGWNVNGPELPVEFARVSEDGRLTLALYNNAGSIALYWAIMEADALDFAICELRCREGMYSKDRIGFIELTVGGSCNIKPSGNDSIDNLKKIIRDWADQNPESLDAVMWTGLESNFEDKTGLELNGVNVVKYLWDLECCTRRRAEEYIRKAPSQIRTTFRGVIETKLGWTPV
jgi:hypothetical protein